MCVAPLTEEDLQTYNMEDADELFGINYCARCQVCTAGCPARAINPDYIGPSHMLAVAFRHFDPYDQADRIVEAVQGGLWDCTMCGTCTAIATSSRSIILPFGRSCAMPLLSAAS